MVIQSLQNPKIKYAIHLQKRHFRNKEDRMIIEGFDENRIAFKHQAPIETLFYCPALFSSDANLAFINFIKNSDRKYILFETNEEVFRKVAYRENPDGFLSVAKQIHNTFENIEISDNPLIIIAESVEKPGNLGTILRTADATSCDLVILTDPTTDISNPNVVRASTGAIFTVPVIETDNAKALKWLQDNNFEILSAVLQTNKEYTSIDMTGPTAIVVGTEKTGLSEFWRDNCTNLVKIPMLGKVNSLNVAAATGIIVYEAVRQRNVSQPQAEQNSEIITEEGDNFI